ncbi:MAG: COX15/CtaA family protein [Acidimicrobiales bacterium]
MLSPRTYRRITMVALVLLAAIVVTGAGVRLTGSGLGCTDWPKCTEQTFTPSTSIHAKIEFYNRMITGLVSAAVIAAVLGSFLRSPRRRDLIWLSLGLVAGVIAQIVLGGLVVLSDLNPWLVQGHFVVSMALVADAVVLTHRAGQPDDVPVRPVVTPALERWGRVLVAAATVVLLTGTLVTGSGPHSGHNEAEAGATAAERATAAAEVRRLPLTVHRAAQVHGLTVWILLAISIWVLVQIRRHQPKNRLLATANSLVTVILLQAAIGYTQYFTGVPPGLVALHILGATLVWIAALMVLLHMRAPLVARAPAEAESVGAR